MSIKLHFNIIHLQLSAQHAMHLFSVLCKQVCLIKWKKCTEKTVTQLGELNLGPSKYLCQTDTYHQSRSTRVREAETYYVSKSIIPNTLNVQHCWISWKRFTRKPSNHIYQSFQNQADGILMYLQRRSLILNRNHTQGCSTFVQMWKGH